MILLSLYCLFWLIPTQTLPPESDIDLAPSLIPSIASGFMLAMALILVIQAWRTPVGTGGKTELDDEFGSEATGIDGEVLANTALWIVVGVVMWLMMEYIAFEVSMTVTLFAVFFFLKVDRYTTMTLLAVVTPFALSQIVFYLFNTVTPAIWR